ncbi:NUDIX domain-containing protein [Deinococcus lacus]|uniref:NUDIX domain-containing protein n=1 Tax=Deinococcus lacus TaxID=392561 RepID=A0ABW1YCT3_9DEIO
MADIRTDLDGTTFAVRAVILCQRGEKVLVEGGPYPFYNLPGGATALGESLRDAAAREWHEETGLTAGELRPVGLIENFFELGGRRWHELGFYYALAAPQSLGERLVNADNAANFLDWVSPDTADKPIYPAPALSLLDVPGGIPPHHPP